MKLPTVTVVLPVYNGATFLRAAIASVRAQTCRDWELLIVDDASTDGSGELAQSFQDPRIRVLRNPDRLRLAGALNRGLEAARGVYLARMDADDLCLPTRLAEQVAFLEQHPDLGLCGTWVRTMGAERATQCYPTETGRLRAFALFNSPFAHPSVLWRRAWFERAQLRYDGAFYPTEDYELWSRALAHFPAANLGRVLLRYRLHHASLTGADWTNMDAQAARISAGLLARLGLHADPDELQLHRHLAQGRPVRTWAALGRAEAWLARVAAVNAASRWSAAEDFQAVTADVWYRLCHHSARLGSGMLRAYAASPFAARGANRSARLSLLGLAVLKTKVTATPAKSGAGSCAY